MPRIPRAIAVASEPTAGRGYALDAKGRIPLAMESGRWTLEFVTVTLDIANTAAHTGGSQSVTIPNLQVGDICIWAGTDTSANAMQYWTEPNCATRETIVLHRFNADAAATDPASTSHYFFAFHRFITS